MLNIKEISREERDYLVANGVKFGVYGGISRTGKESRRHCKYYLCESKENMILLNNIRKNVK